MAVKTTVEADVYAPVQVPVEDVQALIDPLPAETLPPAPAFTVKLKFPAGMFSKVAVITTFAAGIVNS